jgi:outer membrane protein assembly complex protein YaeT
VGWCARLLALCAVLIATVRPAAADVRDFLGRPLADLRVELGGQPLTDPAVLQLIETRIGEPLSMERVRETLDHLVGLSRFEDVRVYAEPSQDRPGAVVLRWVLVPVQRIGRIAIVGELALDVDVLREELRSRLGLSLLRSQAPEIENVLREAYGERGYRRPAIELRFVTTRAVEVVDLTVAVDAGARTLISAATVAGDLQQSAAATMAALRIEKGRPYDRADLASRTSAVEQAMRDQGYYEARVTVTPEFSADESTVALTVSVDRGPRVRVVFAGDSLPEGRRDILVPIRQERSVDLDLLEDASRNIEAYLRQEGYRSATARYVREETGGEMILTFTIDRGPLHRLRAIDVAGTQAVPRAAIEPLLVLKTGEPFVDARAGAVAAAIAELYRVRGYARASVKPEISVAADAPDESGSERPVSVRFVITEGEQTSVGAVEIEGAREVDAATLRAIMALQPGRPFYRPQLDADRESVERHYRNGGFQNVRIDVQTPVSADGRTITLRWIVTEGPRTVIDRVLVSGQRRTSPELVRREAGLVAGQPLGEDALIEAQRRLASLGLFRRVRIVELPHVAANRRDVLIEVDEAPSTTIAYGGGVEAGRRARTGESGEAVDRIEVAPRGFFEVTRRNVWGGNRSISLFTRVSLRARDPAIDTTDPTDEGGYGFNEYRVLATFREPRAFRRPGDLQFTAFLEQAIRASFNFTRRGGQLEYSRRLSERLTLSGRYALDTTRLFDQKIAIEDRVSIDRFFPQARLSTFTGSVLRDSRNDVLDPEGGTLVGVDATLAARALGSENGFVKTFAQAFWYRRLPGLSHLTVVMGARVGLAEGFERLTDLLDSTGAPVLGPDGEPVQVLVDDVPARERFFAGGGTTVRGFVLDRLGTCGAAPVCNPATDTLSDLGFPTGGNGLVVINLELRTAYWKGLSGVAFFDAGNVFKRADQIALGELRPAVGFGVRFRSPIGPVRGDLGFNMNPRTLPGFQLGSQVRERGVVFHISLGQAF